MAKIFGGERKESVSLPDDYELTREAHRRERAAIDARKNQAEDALYDRIEAEAERAEGVGLMDVEERRFRSNFADGLLRVGVNSMIEVLRDQLALEDRIMSDMGEFRTSVPGAVKKLEPEKAAILAQIDRLLNIENETLYHTTQAYGRKIEALKNLEAFLDLAERIERGERISLRAEPDPAHEPLQQPFQPAALDDVADYAEGRISRGEAEKILADSNRRRAEAHKREYAAQLRAHTIGVTVAALRRREERRKQARGGEAA
jgi:hypothetical protein